MPRSRSARLSSGVLGLAAATVAPGLLLICGCCGLVEPSRQPSDGSEPSTDHSRYDLEPQDQVAGGRWLLHVGGSRGLLPGLESATAKISGSGRSGVPPNMSTWCIPSGVARGAAQPEHDMARPALQHHPTHGARARAAWRCRKTHTCTNTKVVRHARFWGLGRAQWADPGPRGWQGCLGSASAPGQCPTALALLRPKRWKSAAQLPAGRLDAKS